MKRIIFFQLIMITSALLCTFGVSAEPVGAVLKADDNIRSGSSFDVVFDLTSNEKITAFEGVIEYENSRLDLKKVTVVDKTVEDVLSYKDDRGRLRFVVGCSENPDTTKTVRFRFAPKESGDAEYAFSMTSCGYCDILTDRKNVTNLPLLRLSVSDSVSESSSGSIHRDTSGSDAGKTDRIVQSDSSGSSGKKRTKTSGVSGPEGDDPELYSEPEESSNETVSGDGQRVYVLPDSSRPEKSSDTTAVVAFAAGAGVVAVGFGAYFMGKRSKK